MSFQLRILESRYSIPDSLSKSCDDQDCDESCDSPTCVESCPDFCHPSSHSKLHTKYLIIIPTLLALALLILCFYVYYVRCFKRRSVVTRRTHRAETRDEFLDEDHGPGQVVDHHIWYINTVGLQPSVINSIAICKYVKGEGLVDGTDCSVCLTEFEEDETLRLLPKCSHAFHVPCIDAWLRAHTNCPMCRAPIVSNTTDIGSSSTSEETRVVITDDDEGGTSVEDEVAVENESSIGESSVQGVRRSVSLDSMAASEITQALACNASNLDNELDKGKYSSLRIVSRRGAMGNQSLLRLMCNSLQTRPIFMKRSFSCNGKFSLPISNNNENPNPNPNRNPPLRSF